MAVKQTKMKFLSFFQRVSVIKTLYFNLYYFGRKGLKLPVLFAPGVKFISLKGKILLESTPLRGQVKFGRNCAVNINGTITFKSNITIGEGSVLYVGPDATLTFGSGFYATSDLGVNCKKKISFGDGCLIAYQVQVLDTDFHRIMDKTGILNPDKEVIIGNHVWIGARTTVLKGTRIADNIVIGAASVLTKQYNVNYSVYAGNPATLVKKNVEWDY